MNKEEYITLYLCNGEDPRCDGCGLCLQEGYPTECKHTSNVDAAEFGPCDEPWRHPDRFKCIVDGNGKMQFWERFPAERLYHYCNGRFDKKDLKEVL